MGMRLRVRTPPRSWSRVSRLEVCTNSAASSRSARSHWSFPSTRVRSSSTSRSIRSIAPRPRRACAASMRARS